MKKEVLESRIKMMLRYLEFPLGEPDEVYRVLKNMLLRGRDVEGSRSLKDRSKVTVIPEYVHGPMLPQQENKPTGKE